MKTITVIGGGTGSFALLSGLKQYEDFKINVIVPSTDSGGSTGKLVDEFGYLPPGDVRQCLVALAPEEDAMLLRKLFAYRFDKGGEGLKGHNFGNLFLTVLNEITGDEEEAINTAKKILDIKGDIYCSSPSLCDLVAEYENGKILTGEHYIDEPPYPHDGRLRISKLYITPITQAKPDLIKAILESDVIIAGPGDLYTSVIANFLVSGIGDAICRSKAKFIYVMNLVTKFGQTYGFKASHFVEEITKYSGRTPDHILINKTELPEEILEKYRLENAFPVEDDLLNSSNVIRDDFLADEQIVTPKGDVLKRSLIRHDGGKIAKMVRDIL